MRLFVQALILGLLTGGVYALMASGLALGFGVMRVINVAQGALIILGAYLSYSLFTDFHLDPFLSLLLVMPAVFVLGVAIQIVFLRPLRSADRESLSLLATYISPVWGKFTFFILLIAILVVRPQGLFGTVERGKL